MQLSECEFELVCPAGAAALSPSCEHPQLIHLEGAVPLRLIISRSPVVAIIASLGCWSLRWPAPPAPAVDFHLPPTPLENQERFTAVMLVRQALAP